MRGSCMNCGADADLHHYQTDQCPVGGVEAINRKQEWQASTFLADDGHEERIKELENKLAQLEAMIAHIQGRTTVGGSDE